MCGELNKGEYIASLESSGNLTPPQGFDSCFVYKQGTELYTKKGDSILCKQMYYFARKG